MRGRCNGNYGGDVKRYYDEEFEVACYVTRGGVPLGCTRVD